MTRTLALAAVAGLHALAASGQGLIGEGHGGHRNLLTDVLEGDAAFRAANQGWELKECPAAGSKPSEDCWCPCDRGSGGGGYGDDSDLMAMSKGSDVLDNVAVGTYGYGGGGGEDLCGCECPCIPRKPPATLVREREYRTKCLVALKENEGDADADDTMVTCGPANSGTREVLLKCQDLRNGGRKPLSLDNCIGVEGFSELDAATQAWFRRTPDFSKDVYRKTFFETCSPANKICFDREGDGDVLYATSRFEDCETIVGDGEKNAGDGQCARPDATGVVIYPQKTATLKCVKKVDGRAKAAQLRDCEAEDARRAAKTQKPLERPLLAYDCKNAALCDAYDAECDAPKTYDDEKACCLHADRVEDDKCCALSAPDDCDVCGGSGGTCLRFKVTATLVHDCTKGELEANRALGGNCSGFCERILDALGDVSGADYACDIITATKSPTGRRLLDTAVVFELITPVDQTEGKVAELLKDGMKNDFSDLEVTRVEAQPVSAQPAPDSTDTTPPPPVVPPTVVVPVVTKPEDKVETEDKGGSDGLSSGATAGVVIGVLVGVAILGAAVYFIAFKKPAANDNDGFNGMTEPSS